MWQEAELKEMFKEYDTDSNGHLDRYDTTSPSLPPPTTTTTMVLLPPLVAYATMGNPLPSRIAHTL